MKVMATQVGEYNRIRVTPVTGSIGAEVSNVDLRDFDDEIITELHHAWMAHKVLFFRDQELSQAHHVAYGRAFGELEIHPFIHPIEDFPELVTLESTPESFSAAEQWHSDVTFRECPPLGSILAARRLPPWGGDTLWANMELAYEMLDDATRSEIDDAVAVHSYVKAFGQGKSDEELAELRQTYPDQKHPVVRTHPVTGRRGLFINRIFTLAIDGISSEESRRLSYQLYDMARIPELQCRFRWQPGSLAQWDNRCTQHYAVPDHGGHHRYMERVTLAGDRPV